MSDKTPPIGTVISGTMRPQDLVPALMEVLSAYDPDAHKRMVMDSPTPVVPLEAMDDDRHEWWASDDARYFLEDLFNALNQVAPDNVYFGAHPGDGSDYGFWPIDE